MALFAEHGYEDTTVAEIAKQAGLTERTFFRHFADKREVLFAGSEILQADFVRAVADAPDSAPPIEAVRAGLEAAAALLPDRKTARRRQAIIASNHELQERELIKLSSLSAAAADALRGRGVSEPAASLTAEMAIAVFRIAYERWLGGSSERDLSELMRESLGELRAVAAG